ncbi:MAG: polysaccharide biosynthesis tyrosine autokinase [Pyrinomonadaceae bacterium]
MERDERLLPLPNINDLQTTNREQDYPGGYPPPYDAAFGDKRSIMEYLHVVYKRLPLILALTILATAVTAFYMYRKPSQYQATAELEIEPPKQSAVGVNINLGNDYKYYNTKLRQLYNRDLMYDVVLLKNLYKNPDLLNNQNNKGVFATIKSIFAGEKPQDSKQGNLTVVSGSDQAATGDDQIVLNPEEKARADMYAGSLMIGMQVEQVEGTNLVRINVTNTNPELAAIVANGVAEVFRKQEVTRETQQSRAIYNDLQKSIADLKTTLTKQENELIAFMKSNDLALIGESGTDLTSGRLNALSTQWLSAMDDRRKVEVAYNTAAKSKDPGSLPQDLVNSEALQIARQKFLEEQAKLRDKLRELDSQIDAAEANRKELLVKYTPEYVEVKKIAAKIEDLKRSRKEAEANGVAKIEDERKKLETNATQNLMSGLRAQLTAAQNRESKIRGEYLAEVSNANVQGQAARELTTLKREIETNRGLLDKYVQTEKEQELALASNTPNNIQVSTKAVSGTLVGPDRNRNIVLAFLVSLVGGIGLSFLLDYLDDSIKTSDDIGRNLGLPTLALIPHQDAISKKQLGTGSDGDGAENVHSLALIALQDTRSPVAEAYRHLRTSLLFSSAGNPPQVILVTSSQPSEGKTTTAINTAITLAQSDDEVVIIDCDLRRPRLHSHFGMNNTHGLTNYLSGDKNTENLLQPCPDLPNLKIISSGPIPPNPAELLSSNEMKNLLQFLKGKYKHVIIDSPPAISFTDSAILSTISDGVVLVAKSGSSSIHLMRRFKQRLAGLGTRIYGVVLNGVKPNSLEYGYYGYDYAYDYYSVDDESTPRLGEDSDHILDEGFDEDDSIHQTRD